MTLRIGCIVGITALAIITALLLPAMPQPLAYHDFADQRQILGVRNFQNVASNAAFLVVGVAGLVVTLGRRATFQFGIERRPYVVLFVAVLFTAAGSAYYHAAPDNEALFFDRLPITIAFMALVASQIVDRIGVRAGLAALLPLLLLGAASVVYWRASERAGAGNVVPYVVLQAYSIVILLFLASMPSRYTCGKYVYWVLAWYVLGKCLETFDAEVLEWSRIVSGHTLKHLAAATAGGAVCLMLTRRTLADTEGVWITPDGRFRVKLRPDGQFDEERTDRPGVHHGRYRIEGTRIHFHDPATGYRATGELRDGVMRAAGCEFRREPVNASAAKGAT